MVCGKAVRGQLITRGMTELLRDCHTIANFHAFDGINTHHRVRDISVGGVALQLPPAVAEFVIGGKLDDCTLRLPELDSIPLHLEVRNINRNVQRSGTELLRLGCQFVGLSRSGGNVIQRYIFNTERGPNARQRGGL